VPDDDIHHSNEPLSFLVKGVVVNKTANGGADDGHNAFHLYYRALSNGHLIALEA